MKINKALVCFIGLAVLCIAAVTLSPRFGYSIYGIDSDLRESKYIYQATTHQSDEASVIYENKAGMTITISYSGRFNRRFVAIHSKESQPVYFDQLLDGGGRTGSDMRLNPYLFQSEYDIITHDASGFYFWIYLRSVFTLILSFLFYRKYKKCKDNRSSLFAKNVLLVLSTALLIIAFALALRFPMLSVFT